MIDVRSYRSYRKQAYEEGMDIVLPSGLSVTIRPASQSAILRSDKVPNTLLKYFASSEVDVSQVLRGKKTTPQEYRENMRAVREYFELLAKEMIIYPQVVNNLEDLETDEQIALEELEDEDLSVLSDWSSKGIKPFVDFFHQQKTGDGPLESQ